MSDDRIAIVGMAGRFPGSSDVAALWENLRAGRQCVEPLNIDARDEKEMAGAHWVETNCLLDDVEGFDAGFFGISHREAEITDPQHRLILEHAWQALEDAGYKLGDQNNVGVFAGANFTSFYTLESAEHLLDVLPNMIGSDKDYLANRISYLLGLSGPAMTVQSACSTSLVAVHLACQSLLAGECDAALAGGVSVTTPRTSRYYYMPGGMLSPDGVCRTFDADAGGTVFAEGAGVVLLMRLEDALEGRYNIYAVIRGSAVNNDGSDKAAYTAPSKGGQVSVVRQAYDVAGLDPTETSYVECHGTATVLGDAIELAALGEVFGDNAAEASCALGSIKTNIGHLASAAGVAGLIKCALMLKHGELLPSLHFQTPNLQFKPGGPFYVNTVARPWEIKDRPRRAGVSSFGVGGTNAHIVLEEPPAESRAPESDLWRVVGLSAPSQVGLEAQRESLRAYSKGAADIRFSDLAFTTAYGRKAFDHRAFLVAKDMRTLGDAFENDIAPWTGQSRALDKPSVVFMFSGQGAQYPEMGAELYRAMPGFRASVDEALSFAPEHVASELKRLVFSGGARTEDAEALNQTALTQPALFITEYALARLWRDFGVIPKAMIGHSIGEFVAACLSGVLSLPDALKLVCKRGELMQSLPAGAMLSVAMEHDAVQTFLSESIDLAAENAPGQFVLAGNSQAIDALESELAKQGAPARRLHTSHAFHSGMMEPILDAFAQAVSEVQLKAPETPYISCVTGQFVTADQVTDPQYWAQQIRSPVMFSRGITTLADSGANLFVEVGPGRALVTLSRSTVGAGGSFVFVDSLPDARQEVRDERWFIGAVGRAWAAGADVDWKPLFDGAAERKISLPGQSFSRTTYKAAAKPLLERKSGGRREPHDWLYTREWKRRYSGQPAGAFPPPGGIRLVFEDAAGISRRVAEALGGRSIFVKHGESFSVSERGDFTVNPKEPEAFQAMLSHALQDAGDLSQIIYGWSLDISGEEEPSVESLADDQGLGVAGARRLLDGLSQRSGEVPLDFVILSHGLFDVVGDELLVPANAPLAAFCNVVPQEHPGLACKLVDLRLDEITGAEKQLVELCSSGGRGLVALRGRHVWEPSYSPVPAEVVQGAQGIRPGGRYLIIGGLGGIGSALAAELYRNHQARLVLTTRRELPQGQKIAPAEILASMTGVEAAVSDSIARLVADGAEIQIAQADVGLEESLRVLRAELEKDGQIDGVIFCAGDMSLRSTHEPFDTAELSGHFGPKVFGLINCRTAFSGLALDFFLVMSSISSVLGGLGHFAYSAANLTADALIARWRRESPEWASIDWDLWATTDRTGQPDFILKLIDQGIRPAEGVEIFERIVAAGIGPTAIAATTDLEERLNNWLGDKPADSDALKSYARPDISTTFEAPEGELEESVASIWCSVLGIESVGRQDDFFEIGGHSLVAIQIVAKMTSHFGVRITAEEAFKASTVQKTAELVEQKLQEQIDSMSDDEIEEALSKV